MFGVQRVAPFGTVDGDGGDTFVNGKVDGHRQLLFKSAVVRRVRPTRCDRFLAAQSPGKPKSRWYVRPVQAADIGRKDVPHRTAKVGTLPLNEDHPIAAGSGSSRSRRCADG